MEKHIDSKFWTIWMQARDAVMNANRYKFRPETDEYDYGPRYWHIAVSGTYSLHPVIERIIQRDCVRPVDWQLLLLEWPHVSTEDETMIAYTRNEAAGEDFQSNGSKRQTRTSVGKYLARHWPHVPDHMRRDWAGRFKPAKYEIWDTIEGIISCVELGPQSCMKSSYGSIPFGSYDNAQLCAWQHDKGESVNWNNHPYIVYHPMYGWRMAVRLDQGRPDIVMGRCLINIDDRTFVRSYARNEQEGGTSYSDEKLEAWLRDQGYTKEGGWNGKRVAKCEHPDNGLMLPYLDGTPQNARDDGSYLTICRGGNLDGTNTDGKAGGDEGDYVGDCVRCDESVYDGDDERITVGRNADEMACGNCAHAFTLVRGESSGYAARRTGYREYYIRNNDSICVNGVNYDPDHLPDCIRVLHDGEYAHEDDCVTVESDGEYHLTDECVTCKTDDNWYLEDADEIVEIGGDFYRKDDDDVVQCRDDKYRLKEDCWQDDETQHWYPDDVEHIEISSGIYHPDTLKQWLIDAGQMNLDLEY